MEPDWIEAEMDDDPDFIRDVIGQRMRNMIKDEVIIFNSLYSKHDFCVQILDTLPKRNYTILSIIAWNC